MPLNLPKTINDFEQLAEDSKQTAIQKVTQVSDQAAKNVGQHVEATGQAVSTQIAGKLSNGDAGVETPGGAPTNDQANHDFVKDLYAPSAQHQPQAQSQQEGQATAPDDQKQIAEAREKLKMHMEGYGNQFTLEGEQARLAKQQQQEAQQKQQLEAEEEQKKKEEEQQRMQALPMPSGKRTGVPDFVIKREQNKAEQNRGTSG